MPPKGGKAESGRAKKAANADKKAADAAAAAEEREAAAWDDPSAKKGKGKDSADAKAEKKAEEARKKAEREALLAEEEASIPDGGKKGPGGAKKAGGKKAGGAAAKPPAGPGIDDAIASFSASNIDDALDALTIATERTDKAAVGSKAAALERHPERRFKAAFEAFKEREMPRIKEERPGMRSQQYHDALYKEFQKHPDNPFNQVTVAYDATKDEKVAALQSKRDATAQRLAGE